MNNSFLEGDFHFEENDSIESIRKTAPPSARVVIDRQLVQGDYWLGPRQTSVAKWFPLESKLMLALNEIVEQNFGVLAGDHITITVRRDEVVDTQYAASNFLSELGNEIDDSQGDDYLKPQVMEDTNESQSPVSEWFPHDMEIWQALDEIVVPAFEALDELADGLFHGDLSAINVRRDGSIDTLNAPSPALSEVLKGASGYLSDALFAARRLLSDVVEWIEESESESLDPIPGAEAA